MLCSKPQHTFWSRGHRQRALYIWECNWMGLIWCTRSCYIRNIQCIVISNMYSFPIDSFSAHQLCSSCDMLFLGSQLSKMQMKLSNKSHRICEKGNGLDEWTWSCWLRQKPVQRERWGLLFPSAQRWHRGHRGQHDPHDPHVTPLYNCLLKVRIHLCWAHFPEMKKTTHVVLAPKILFYWQQYICVFCSQILQTVNIKN